MDSCTVRDIPLQIDPHPDLLDQRDTTSRKGDFYGNVCASIESGADLNIILIQVLSGIFFVYLGFFFNSEQ
jgi:hypothetical protein